MRCLSRCLRELLASLTDSSKGYSALTLRFNSPEMEAAFASGRRDSVARGLKAISGVAASAVAVALVFDLPSGLLKRSTYASEIGYTAGQLKLGGYIFFVILNLLVFAALRVQRLVRSLQPAVLELIAIVIPVVNMVTFLTLPIYSVKILGSSVEDALGKDKYASDSHLLLFVDTMITAAHVACPLRWCILVYLDVAGIIMYMLTIFVIGGNEPMFFSIQSLILLTLLAVIVALGKRSSEMTEREAFMEIIKEKCLRFNAEYVLETTVKQASRQKRAEEAEETADVESQRRSNPESVPTTAISNRIFDDIHDKEESAVATQLGDIVQVGQREHWCLKETDVKLHPKEVLGSGGFGQVVKGTFCGVKVAVKIPHDKRQVSDLRALSALCNELRVLRHLRHPNIVAMHGAVIVPKEYSLSIVLEFVHGPVLKRVVADGDRVGIPARCQLILGVCSALLYLHSRQPRVVHGDLKNGNVMVEIAGDKFIPKLLDFGLSRVITRRARRLGGTLRWMAPELCQVDAPVKCSSDVYSFGRLIAFIATGEEPMSDMRPSKIRRKLKQGRPPPATWPPGCAFKPGCEALVRACILPVEGERPLIAEAHQRLVALPRELGVAQTHRHAFEDLEISYEDQGGHSDSADMGSGSQGLVLDFGFPAHHGSADTAPQDLAGGGERLCPLPEDEPLGAAEQAVSQETSEGGRANALPQDAPLRQCAGEGQQGAAMPALPHLPGPERHETTLAAMEMTLVKAVSRWHFDRPTSVTCCPRHRALELARLVCKMALTWPCVGEPSPTHATQCLQCGILGIAGGECDLCGQDGDSEEENVQQKVSL